MQDTLLQGLRQDQDRREAQELSSLACLSRSGQRRQAEKYLGYRQSFAQDADRILHSRAYSRYIDKTQVFSLVANDHISHRALHVQLVSRIGRTIGRYLRLNEDLIEAIALGHDIGHPPFGHEGERILSALCREHGLPAFLHNVQSVRFLDRIERQGRGWNLTLQVLDGILCHDGEVHSSHLAPQRDKDFVHLDSEIREKELHPLKQLYPMTLEGCVVRLADTIAYIGRDIEDAIELGLIARDDIPASCAARLGRTNGTIVYNLVTDLIGHTLEERMANGREGTTQDWIGWSQEVANTLLLLKQFNYKHIYHNKALKVDLDRIKTCYRELFLFYMKKFGGLAATGERQIQAAARARDHIAGMTDAFFLRQARAIGCPMPEGPCGQN